MQWSHADLKKMIHFNKVIFAAPVTSSQRVHQLSPALTSCRIIKLRLNHSRDEDLKQHSLWFTLQTDIFYEQALAFKETLILFASAFMQTGETNDSDSSIFCSAACINGHHYLSTRFMFHDEWWTSINWSQTMITTCYMCSGLFTMRHTVSLLGMWYSAITVCFTNRLKI